MLDYVWFFNWIEVGLWTVLGLVAWSWKSNRVAWMRSQFPAGLALFVFAWSDYVETQSGAWWFPWWLLPLKASCVLVLIFLGWRYYGAVQNRAPNA
jgi:hypothetical protein